MTVVVSKERQLSVAYSARAYATTRAGFSFCGKGASTCSSWIVHGSKKSAIISVAATDPTSKAA
jgi:hypothetical protein